MYGRTSSSPRSAARLTARGSGVWQPDAPPEAEPTTPSARPSIGPVLRRLHFYAGVLVAPFLITAALTGLIYTITPQLDELIYRDQLWVAEVGEQAVPLSARVRAAQAAVPNGTVAMVRVSDAVDETTPIVFLVPELQDRQRTAYVDPYSGDVRGVLTTQWSLTPLATWFSLLHKNLHLGEPGRLYSELAASWLWVLVLVGIVLWFRHQRGGFRLHRLLAPDAGGAAGVGRTRSWHASAGLWLAVGLLFLSATGLTWSTYAGARFDLLQNGLSLHMPAPNTALEADGIAGGVGEHHHGGMSHAYVRPGADVDLAGIDDMLAIARARGLDGPVEIVPPPDAGHGWSIAQVDNRWPVRRDAVAIDPRTGAVIDDVRWAEQPLLVRLSQLGIQAHMGLLFGPLNRVALAAVAVGLIGLIFWGYRMWWQRRPRHDGGQLRLGRPPRPGGWRRLPRRWLVLGVAVMLAVSWAVPLLGASLVGFLVIDVLVGRMTRWRQAASASVIALACALFATNTPPF